MTVTDIAHKLLTYFAPEERSIPDSALCPGCNDCVLDAINGALQGLFGDERAGQQFAHAE